MSIQLGNRVKGKPTALGRRRALGTVAIVAIGVLVIVIAAAVAVELASTRSTSNATRLGPLTAVAKAIDAKGDYVTNATLKIGDELRLSVTVTNGTDPIAVHMVYNGNVYPDHPWNVNATHYNFIIDSGPADVTDLGVNSAYAVISFQDGAQVQSNNVTFAVTR